MNNKFEAQRAADNPSIVIIWSNEYGYAGSLRFLSETEAQEFCNLVNKVVTVAQVLDDLRPGWRDDQ